MAKEKKQKPKKFSWKEHDKWINGFANVKTIYPEVKPSKRKRKK
jgi:hypothetical protein